MKLIIGLGNPSEEYDNTRHNIGREVVRALSDDWRLQKKLHAEIAMYTIHKDCPCAARTVLIRPEEKVILVLPTTYMNDSGRAVQKITTTYNLQPTTLLVVHDDIDLPIGALRFSKGASAGGHKGIQSIIDALGAKNFARLRIGVAGKRRSQTDAAAYVLKKFEPTERPLVAEIKKRAQKALMDYCTYGLAHAMEEYNGKPKNKIPNHKSQITNKF